MALFYPGILCPICYRVVQAEHDHVGFHHFLGPTHSLAPLSDAVVHRACLDAWEHRDVFLRLSDLATDIAAQSRSVPQSERGAWLDAQWESFEERAAALDPGWRRARREYGRPQEAGPRHPLQDALQGTQGTVPEAGCPPDAARARPVRGGVLVRGEVCRCRRLAERGYMESLRQGRYVVHTSSRCLSCGWAEEAEDDVLQAGVRAEMLALHGVWSVAVPDAARLRALGSLRAELQMSIADVAATRGKTGPLARGTFVEMMRLKLLLAARGIEAEVCEVIPRG